VLLTNGYDQDNATPINPKSKIQIHQVKDIKPGLQGWDGTSD
jgi:hypothetical protein